MGGHYEAEFAEAIRLDKPAWFALRTPPPPVKGDAKLTEKVGRNALGRDLFSHTSPIYITLAGKSHYDRTVAKQLLSEMLANRRTIMEKGKFKDAVERARVLDVYSDGIAAMRKRLDRK